MTGMGLVGTGATIQSSGVALRLNARFRGTYDMEVGHWKAILGSLMDEVPTDTLIENFFYRETRPYPTRWPRGTVRGTKGFKTIRWSTVTKDWTDGVGWHSNDVSDDLSRTLEPDVRATASRWATLPMRVRAQIFEATTDGDLLDSIPNAPDGVGIFSATDGTGGNRFGVSGGNIITATGLSNESMILKDFFRAQTRWARYLDTENQPLIDPGIFAGGFVVEYPPELEEVMARAFEQAVQIQTVKATGVTGAATSAIAAAGISSIIKDGKYGVTRLMNPWLSDASDWYIHLKSPNVVKSTYKQVNQGIKERILTADTGDSHAIRTKEEGIFWDSREGYGVNLPFASLKVNTA